MNSGMPVIIIVPWAAGSSGTAPPDLRRTEAFAAQDLQNLPLSKSS